MMLLAQQRRLVELLRARRHIQRRVFIEEIHRLHRHLDRLARHHWEVLNSWNLENENDQPHRHLSSPLPHRLW